MKRIFALLLASLFLTCALSRADNTNSTAGTLDLKGLRVAEVLPLYQNLCGHKLLVDSHVKSVIWTVTIHISGASLSKDELVKRFREALLKQAGIVITPLDDRRESVTCNDALPIEVGTKPARL